MLKKIIRNQKLNVQFWVVTVVFFALCFFYFNQTPVLAGWLQRQKITSNPLSKIAEFGKAVAISGDGSTMVVGSPQYSANNTTEVFCGSAFVYKLNNGAWVLKEQLLASNRKANDHFGNSVAIYGNTIVVGAIGADAPLSDQGAVYVFEFNGMNWIERKILTATQILPKAPVHAYDEFGSAVAMEGDTIIVGAHQGDYDGFSDSGMAYVFQGNGTNWTQSPELIPTHGPSGWMGGDYFGCSVVMNSGRIAIGSSGSDTPKTSSGAIYVFSGNGGVYSLQQKLSINGATGGEKFGKSVAMEGNTLVGGAPNYMNDTGAAVVFNFNGNTWQPLALALTASNGANSDRFGSSVAINSNVIAVGAPNFDPPGNKPDAGLVYIFVSSVSNGTTSWLETQKVAPADHSASDRFGSSVALKNNQLLVGAATKELYNSAGTVIGQGAVYHFTPPVKFDFNGDGIADFAVLRPLRQLEWWVRPYPYSRLTPIAFGMSSDKPIPADFDGDGKTDVAVFRPSTGEWLILRSSDSSSYSISFGNSEDKPAPDDFDGDGLADLAIFRPSEGNWYVLKSSTCKFEVTELGKEGDMPLTSDFDGDRRADLGVFRPSTGQWIINQSTAGLIKTTFGIGTDKPVPADYTGDGKTDIAVWRAERGEWYVLRSEDSRYFVVPFGQNGDIPVPGDYDGDGKADIGVFRPDEANWFIQRSTQGLLIQQFGIRGDIPVQAISVQ